MLTDTHARKAKAAERPYKLADAGGLHLFVTPAGGKLWRYRYSFAGREKLLSLGSYPDVSLADARAARDSARAELRAGQDPGEQKKRSKATADLHREETIETLAREWHTLTLSSWVPHHASDVMISLEQDVFPAIGGMGIRSVSPPDVLALVRSIEARGAIETARRVRRRLGAIMDFAIATGRAEINPATSVRAVMAKATRGRQPAITSLDEAPEILAKVEAEAAHPVP